MTDEFSILRIHGEDESGEPLTSAHRAELVLDGDQQPGPPRTLLVSWAGHSDAGSLSEQVRHATLEALPHRLIASFAVDELFDYRSRRPQISFDENRFSKLEGPDLHLYEVEDALGTSFLLLTGDEPDFMWEKVVQTVVDLVDHLNVRLVVMLDAMGLPAPHTRPLGVTAHGNRPDLIEGISTWSPQARMEAGLAQILELRLDEAERDVVGYTIHVPHYLASGRYPQVAVAALEYAGAAGDLILPTDSLRSAARSVEQDVTQQISKNPQIGAVIQQLEENFDQYATPQQRSLLVKRDQTVPDAEELGAAVEEFLRAQDFSEERPENIDHDDDPSDGSETAE